LDDFCRLIVGKLSNPVSSSPFVAQKKNDTFRSKIIFFNTLGVS
jgi:hypothetical protein